jgi:hypothetical protein
LEKGLNARILLSAATTAICVTATAYAQTIIGTFKEWSAYTWSEGTGKTCVVVSQPIASIYSQTITGRGDVLFAVTRYPSKKNRGQVSTIIGYPFAENAKVTVEVDGSSKFIMSTEKDTAWLEDPTQDSALLEAMRKGDRMIVEGKSRRGTTTADTYSLAGITAALKAVSKACP